MRLVPGWAFIITLAIAAGPVRVAAATPVGASVGVAMTPPGASEAELLLRQGRQAAHAGAHDQALRLLRRSLAVAPEQITPLVDLGVALADLGAYDVAQHAFERALRVGPDDAAALNGLGYVMYRLERLPVAIEHYRKAIARRDDPQYHLNLGLAYLAQQRWGQAEDEFRLSLRGSGASYWALNNLGYALQLQGHTEEALKAYQSALPLGDRDITAHSNMGALLLALENWRDAAWVYEDALKRDDGSADAHLGLANAWTQLGRLDDAILELRVSTALRPPTPSVHHLMAQLYLHRGEHEAARREAQAAVQGAPREADHHLALARALVVLDQSDEAAREFETFLELSPQAEEAPKVRQWLQQHRMPRLGGRR